MLTASIALRRSPSRHGLYRKATAPSPSARACAWSSACDVIKMIGTRQAPRNHLTLEIESCSIRAFAHRGSHAEPRHRLPSAAPRTNVRPAAASRTSRKGRGPSCPRALEPPTGYTVSQRRERGTSTNVIPLRHIRMASFGSGLAALHLHAARTGELDHLARQEIVRKSKVNCAADIESGRLRVTQAGVNHAQVVPELLTGTCAQQDGGDRRLHPQPDQGDLRRGLADLCRDLFHLIDDRQCPIICPRVNSNEIFPRPPNARAGG